MIPTARDCRRGLQPWPDLPRSGLVQIFISNGARSGDRNGSPVFPTKMVEKPMVKAMETLETTHFHVFPHIQLLVYPRVSTTRKYG